MQNPAKNTNSALTCSCGFFTSHADYMLLHLKESGSDCIWNDAQRAMALARMRRINLEIQIANETLALLEVELSYLSKIYQSKPEAKAPRQRNCRKCGKLTFDRFGGTAFCLKHVGVDSDVASVLEEFLYGKD